MGFGGEVGVQVRAEQGVAHRQGRGAAGGGQLAAVAVAPSPVSRLQLPCRLSATSFAQTLPGQSQGCRSAIWTQEG